jgi:putative nucleotidyltransferase with HDIG domain
MVEAMIGVRTPRMESEATVAIPDRRFAFPGYTLMLPAVVDEIVRLIDAEAGALIKYDAPRSEILIELGRSNWKHWTGTRFKPMNNVVQVVSSTGQIDLTSMDGDLFPDGFRGQDQQIRYLAHSPLFINGYNLGAIWIGHQRRISSHELLILNSMGDVLANVMYCFNHAQQKDSDPMNMIQALVKLLGAWDVPIYQHSVRMVSWARAIARRLGCPELEIQTIGWAALLHDIGKMGIPKAILHKPGPLTEEEWRIIRLHPKLGAKMIEPVSKLSQVCEIIQSHHEKYDGSGYPDGLAAGNIPFGARIIAVVDAYSAMTEERIYRPIMNHEQAIEEIKKCSGTHFDPVIANAFLDQFC